MTADNESNHDNKPLEAEKPGRGRRATGQSRAEIEAKSTKARKSRLLASGKRNVDTYVEPETKQRLQELKVRYGVKTEGEVLDRLVAEKFE